MNRSTINLHLGDSLEAMKEYPDNHWDLAICDPPYGINYSSIVSEKTKKWGWKERVYSNWDNETPPKEYFTELQRVSVNQIIWGGNYFADLLPASRCWIVWDKVQRINQADCELAWTSFDGSARVFQYARGNESGFAPKLAPAQKMFANIHPCQKPQKLYEWLLTNYAKEGDKILDTHLGSCSIAIAAHNLCFDLDGWELDADYHAAGVKRFEQHKRQIQLF